MSKDIKVERLLERLDVKDKYYDTILSRHDRYRRDNMKDITLVCGRISEDSDL